MKTKINLLPVSLRGKNKIEKYGQYAKQVVIIVSIIVLGAAVAGGGYILYLTNQRSALLSANSKSLATLESLKSVEQEYFLVVDRINKISPVFSKRTALSNISATEGAISTLPGSVRVAESEINTDNMKITLITASSEGLLAVFNNFSSSDAFKTISLENFAFNPAEGYQITFKLSL